MLTALQQRIAEFFLGLDESAGFALAGGAAPMSASRHGKHWCEPTPVSGPWISGNLGVLPSTIRQDRILHEAIASGDDIRHLCDLFGIGVMTAQRYVDIILRPDENAFT